MKESKVLEAINNRFACKNYLDKEINKEDLLTIAEAGRLSPTSFGLEHFDIYICKSKDIINACFMQESMLTAPITMVLTVKRAKYYEPNSEWIKERAKRFPGTVEEFIDDYSGYYHYLEKNGNLDYWAKSQSYIALGNMMTVASELGIESCAIEGYDNDKLIASLGLSGEEDQIGIVCAFGYPNEKRDRVRRPICDVVKYYNKEN